MALTMAAPERIETGRLVLRKPTPDDADAIFTRYASDPEVVRYVGFPIHRSTDDTHAFLARADAEWKRNGVGAYVLETRGKRQFLGGTGLHIENPYRAATGYVLAQDAWGMGYATEALRAMTDLAAELRIVRLTALTHPDHRASWRVLEKCGFEREAVLRRHFLFPNLPGSDPVDVFLYARIFEPEKGS
jgi:RimJ/RimL family protein N-acetyltransferase